MEAFKIYYKSDFIVDITCDVGWATPFILKFFCGKYERRCYEVGWDGETWTGCKLKEGDATTLEVGFDDHGMACGTLYMEMHYMSDNSLMKSGTYDQYVAPRVVTTKIDDTEFEVVLDVSGDDSATVMYELPMMEAELQRQANEVIRIANEDARIAAETTRQSVWETLKKTIETWYSDTQTSWNTWFDGVKTAWNTWLNSTKSEWSTWLSGTNTDWTTWFNAVKSAWTTWLSDTMTAWKTFDDSANEAESDRASAESARATAENAREAQASSDHTQATSDHTTAESDHSTAQSDHTQAGKDSTQAASDHSQASSDHTTASSDHTQAGKDSTQAASDHTLAASDHATATSDHSTAQSDHTQAGKDSTQAASDHSQASSDHTTASSDHTQAGKDSTQAASDHTLAASDHTTATSDHSTAVSDHSTVQSDIKAAQTAATNSANSASAAATSASNAETSASAAATSASNTEAYMNDLKTAIAELPDGTAVSEKVAEHTVEITDLALKTDNKLDAICGKNLFNKDSSLIVAGAYINQSGVEVTNPEWEYFSLDVEEGDSFAFVFPYFFYAFFNGEAFITGEGGYNKATITAPANANKVYISVLIANADKFQVEKGTSATSYEEYKQYIDSDENIKDSSIAVEKVIGLAETNEQVEANSNEIDNIKNIMLVPDAKTDNLFILNTIIKGYYYNSNGEKKKLDGWNCSPFISVKPSAAYTKQSCSCVMFDSNKEFKSFVDASTPNLTTTEDTAYIVLSFTDAYINSISLFEGEYTGGYIEGKRLITTAMVKGLDDNLAEKDSRLDILEVDVQDVIKPKYETENLLNADDFTHKGYWAMSGSATIVEAPNDDWGYFPLIETNGGKTYTKNNGALVCMYDSDRAYLGRSLGSETTFTTIDGTKYIGLSINPTYVSTAQFVEGKSIPSYYEPHNKKFTLEQIKYGENLVIVGKNNCDFSSIKDAVSYCRNKYGTATPSTILVMSGTYNEDINIVGYPISIVGINREQCVITMHTNDYYAPPIEMAGGNTVENLTIIAYIDEDEGATSGTIGGSYGIHCDFATEGDVVVRNCNVISYGSCAIGIGGQNKQRHIIDNCYLYTNNDNANNKVTLLYHSRQLDDAIEQKLIVKNCNIISDIFAPISLIDSNHASGGGGGDQKDTTLSFYGNCSLSKANNTAGEVYTSTPDMTGTGKAWGWMKLTADSYGNNMSALNY